ncbi:carboxypeptidase-like regulatory domain-containing protein [Cyclobacterium plantarum]|uniref:Carboxypeptidase-like regulatory domain-containing protein n=1 Tax=Cyclobacterium plantarum TaxID=2716263 RepID=A0ABX0H877_9BACT|nr:carboxypeptidase-like regulatory domain-containing protein [Cyclobacterium plantarum]NHE57807.1 carboxypeptidase-like regulatory domain-containing protein [Cyclobacterium plantarum]
MKILSLSIFFACLYGIVYSQTNSPTGQLSGSVLDEGNKPLDHVYFFLKNYPEFNGLSNSSGHFSRRFPEVLKEDTLVVNHPGYQRLQVPLARLKSTGNSIRLAQAVIGLEEVIVKPEDTSLEEMISKAIDNIPQNYPNKRHQLSGLYRKVSTNYDDFTHLVEAVVTVEDLGYEKDVQSTKIKMESLRQSDEHAEVDPYISAMKAKIRNQIESMGEPVGALNPIIGTYPSNYIRTAYVPESHFGRDGYRFMGIPELPVYHQFLGMEFIGTDTIYHIAFGSDDPPDGRNFLKINGRNHAIVEYQLGYRSGEHQVYVKFREVDDRYYPEIIRLKSLRLINRDVGVHQMDIHTLWFDKVNTDHLKKIRPRELLKREQEIEPNEFPLDEGFWKDNEFLKNHPLDSAIINSLERNGKLLEQFEQNAKD